VVISAAHFATLPASAVIGPVKKAGVKRLLVVGGAGSLLLPGGTRVIDSPGFPAEYKAEASSSSWLPARPVAPMIAILLMTFSS
jgi:hypothetical protein